MLSPKEIALEACVVGEAKITKKNRILFVSAILAGMYIAIGFYAYIVVASGFAKTPYPILGTYLGALVFPVGIVLVILTGSDLFTGNCLITLGCMHKKYTFRDVLKNLSLVFTGNLVGSLIFVSFIYFSHVAEQEALKNYIVSLGEKKTGLSFDAALFRGILCNIAVSLAVYLSFSAKNVNGKIVSAFLPVFLFVVSGYEHSIANMFILPLAYILNMEYQLGYDITIMGIFNNLLPVTIGNIIGGAIIVPYSYYHIYIKLHK